jgi:hypothetical protein
MNDDLKFTGLLQPQAESRADGTASKTPGPALNAWQRMPNESAPAFAAFRCYLEMGPARSNRKAAKKMGGHNSQISLWGVRFNWRNRALAWDEDRCKTRDVERRKAIQAEARLEAEQYTARQQAQWRQDEKRSDQLFAVITTMLAFPESPSTITRQSPDGKITTNTKVNNPRGTHTTAARALKLVSDMWERRNREARGIADKEQECDEEWRIEGIHIPKRLPSQIAGDAELPIGSPVPSAGDAERSIESSTPSTGDAEKSIGPSALSTEEMAGRKTDGPIVDAWDRLPQESAPAFDAFRAFLEMGPARSCRKLGKDRKRQRSQILDWSRKYDWQNRARAWDDDAWEAKHVERTKATKAEAERSAKDQTAREQAQRQQEEKILDRLSDRALHMLQSSLVTTAKTTVDGPDGKITHNVEITPVWTMNDLASILKIALELRQRSNRNARAMAEEEQERAEDWNIEDDDTPQRLPGQIAGDAERFIPPSASTSG